LPWYLGIKVLAAVVEEEHANVLVYPGKAVSLLRSLRSLTVPNCDEILSTMKSAGYGVRESNPFEGRQIFGTGQTAAAPIVGRLEMMWQTMRETVAATFPKAPGLPKDKAAYLQSVDEIYQSDAYHSLSIEGYSVTPALVGRVREGNWDPDHHDDDRKSRDALAARGYWQTFQLVKASVEKVITGESRCARARGAQGVVSRIVPALRHGWFGRAWGARGIPKHSGLSSHVALCPSPV
jgi:hypothetical protein